MATPTVNIPQRTFLPLPLGTVLPRGWLREQLKIQAEGLAGNLEEVFPDLGPQSAWLGGKGENWELGPYYLDGLVPLAIFSRIPSSREGEEVDELDPLEPGFRRLDRTKTDHEDQWWPRAVMLKVLAQYAEASRTRGSMARWERIS